MKKLCLFILLPLLFLTACDIDRTAIAPSGIAQRLNPSQEEVYDDQQQYVELNPVIVTIPTAQPIDDGVLRLSMRHPLTLNPLINEDVTVARILRLIFEPLVVLDENFRPTSHLAEIEFASDFSSVVLTIRSDAFWSDGMPVTSDDLIFSVQTLRAAPANAIYRQNVDNIANITRISTRAVQVHFHNTSLCAAMSLNFPIIPQHHYRNQLTLRSANNMVPLGNAPFMLESFTPMRNITLVQNPYSFRQRPQIEQVEVIFVPDAQTDLYAFDQGRVDAIHLPLTEWARHHSVRHIRHEIFPAMYFEFVGFNFQRDIFDSHYTRQGIAHAFDICSAIEAVYLNHAVRAISPIHPYMWAASGTGGLAFDPTRARALLNTVEVLQPLIVLVNTDNVQRVSIAHRLASSLNAVGLPAVVGAVPYTEYFARLASGDFDLFIGGVNLAFAPDVSFFFQGGFYMYDPQLQNAFDATGLAVTEAAYMHAIAQFQQAFAERLPVISLAFRHSAMLTNMRISQAVPPTPDNVLGGVNMWGVE